MRNQWSMQIVESRWLSSEPWTASRYQLMNHQEFLTRLNLRQSVPDICSSTSSRRSIRIEIEELKRGCLVLWKAGQQWIASQFVASPLSGYHSVFSLNWFVLLLIRFSAVSLCSNCIDVIWSICYCNFIISNLEFRNYLTFHFLFFHPFFIYFPLTFYKHNKM